MAQTGYTPIQLYRSATASAAPTAGNLADGELALNTADGKLFYKDSGGVVQVLATKAGAAGDVVGPASATDGGLVAFDGTSGKLVKAAATVTIAQGGTGATTDSGARTNLGGTTVGQSYFTLANPSAITFPRMNADNTVSALSASDFRTAIGAGSGTGTVTSVDVSGGTTGLTTSGGPVTSSGTITLAGTLSAANGGTGLTSPGTSGNVLTSNGTGWVSQAMSGMVYPGAGIAVSTGSAWTTSKTAPAGAIVGTTDSQTLTNKSLTDPLIGGYRESVLTANTGTAYTISIADLSILILTLTGNCTFTFPTATSGRSFTILLKQDATGSRTVTWPAAVKWPNSVAPTITATASKGDKFVFTADGTNWWGSVGGQNYL